MNVTVNYLPTANLTSHCNLNCDCDDHWYEPVCGANQKTYFNPCYAGCRDLEVTKTPEGTTIWVSFLSSVVSVSSVCVRVLVCACVCLCLSV